MQPPHLVEVGLQAQAASPKLRFRSLPGRDVLAEHEDAADPSVFMAPGLRLPAQPAGPAVSPPELAGVRPDCLACEGGSMGRAPSSGHVGDRVVMASTQEIFDGEIEDFGPTTATGDVDRAFIEHRDRRRRVANEAAQQLAVARRHAGCLGGLRRMGAECTVFARMLRHRQALSSLCRLRSMSRFETLTPSLAPTSASHKSKPLAAFTSLISANNIAGRAVGTESESARRGERNP